MATVVKIGPADHGRPMSREEFQAGDVRGRIPLRADRREALRVAPTLPYGDVRGGPDFREADPVPARRPDVLNYVPSKARVFVPGRLAATTPEPDQAAYRDFPVRAPVRTIRWQDVSPFSWSKSCTETTPTRIWVRNVALYFQVPSINEYWVMDVRDDPDRPNVLLHRRHGNRLRRHRPVDFGETYTTRLLPDFELILDPRR